MKKLRLFCVVNTICFLISIVIACGIVHAQKECDIVAIEKKNEEDNDYVTDSYKELKKYSNLSVIKDVQNLNDLQTKVSEKFTADGCSCIRNFFIIGHGSEGAISVGDGQYKNTPNGQIDGNEAQWNGPLLSISFLFCSQTPQLFLIGCNVGACDDGSGKLYKLAQRLNAIVKAPVDETEGGEIVD
jgi:hypothetical protein